MTIYRYGAIGWVWRLLALLGLVGAGVFVLLIVRFGDWWPLAGAMALGLPSVLFPLLVAERIDRFTDDELVVTNLFFIRRRIDRNRIGHPRLRKAAHGALPRVKAPRAWIPVKGGLPIYIDLYATIPDATALRSALGIPRKWLS